MLHGLGLLRQQYQKLSVQAGGAQMPDGTVAVLAERLVDDARAPEDRRAAILSLKALTRDHAVAVGTHALVPLLRWLKQRTGDEDMVRAAVECCLALCQAPADAEAARIADAQRNMGRVLGEPDALVAVLALLAPQHSFYTRFAALQLLATLLEHRREEVQEYVLSAPGGSSAVLQCLDASPSSSMEIIRNEALLLLPALVAGSADLQKIVAFEGAFERLLDITAQEGRIEGGVVVQDALDALHALLLHNVSNQNYFRETLSIPLLAPLLFYPLALADGASDAARSEHAAQLDAFLLQEWDEQKLTNALLLVRCMLHLVEGHGDGHRANQLAMRNSGLTACLVQLAFASLAPPLLKAHTLHLLAAVLRGSRPNQDLVSTLVVRPVALVRADAGAAAPADTRGAADEPPLQLAWQAPQAAMLCLVALALRGPGATARTAQSLAVRFSAVAAFDALVAQNVDVRMTILQALVAAPAPAQNHGNASHLLLDSIANLPVSSALVSSAAAAPFDPYQYLFACIMLAALLQGSDTAKAFARQIQLNSEGRCVAVARPPSDADDEPLALVHQLIGNLAMAAREHAEAVRRERAAQESDAPHNSSTDWTRVMVGYLTLLAMWLWQSPASIADLVSESANLQVLVQPVAQASGVDALVQALSAFVLGAAYEFNTLAGGRSAGSEASAGGVSPADAPSDTTLTRKAMHAILHTRVGADQFSVRLLQLKNDPRFAACGPDALERILAVAAAPGDVEEPGVWFVWPFVEFWKDNYMRVQKAILVDPAATSESAADTPAELLDAREQIAALHAELQRVRGEGDAAVRAAALEVGRAGVDDEVAALRAELAQRDTELQRVRTQCTELEASAASSAAAASAEQAAAAERAAELSSLRAQLTEQDGALSSVRAEATALRAQLTSVHAALSTARAHATDAPTQPDASAELDRMAQETEDLLVLLDDLTTKRQRDKARMRASGWDVSDEDEDDG
ncbi:type I protein arginine methyltransferase [Malassezia sp. CBS 17886]|nr:type I protein arginine methyltransferase [Malassezia sp. CBS 17886]